jgi:hypothetical protein
MLGPATTHRLCTVANMYKHNACLLAHIAQSENGHLWHACNISILHVTHKETHIAPSQYAREPVSLPAQTQLQGMCLRHACWQSPQTLLMPVITSRETVSWIDFVCMHACMCVCIHSFTHVSPHRNGKDCCRLLAEPACDWWSTEPGSP